MQQKRTRVIYIAIGLLGWFRWQVTVRMQLMADWRHIQGKIRKARTSSDPPGQLAALYESTRDAMVAFELARLHEKNGSNADAATWYLTAAEKFRRAQWKTKAQEALVRLGVEVPLAIQSSDTKYTNAHQEHKVQQSRLSDKRQYKVRIGRKHLLAEIVLMDCPRKPLNPT